MIKDLITIVIPCKNEEEYILNILIDINFSKGICGTKVIIADGGSTDKTLGLIRTFIATKLPCIDIEIIEGGSVSKGRNNGADMALTDWVLFIDADTRIQNSKTIYEAYLACESKKYDLITTKTMCVSDDWKAKLMFGVFNIIQKLMPESFATGVFMLIRKQAFNTCGKFDETVHQSEDYLLTRQIPSHKFLILNKYCGQDNRRFLKTGYFGMIKMMFVNYLNKNNIDNFRKDINYW